MAHFRKKQFDVTEDIFFENVWSDKGSTRAPTKLTDSPEPFWTFFYARNDSYIRWTFLFLSGD